MLIVKILLLFSCVLSYYYRWWCFMVVLSLDFWLFVLSLCLLWSYVGMAILYCGCFAVCCLCIAICLILCWGLAVACDDCYSYLLWCDFSLLDVLLGTLMVFGCLRFVLATDGGFNYVMFIKLFNCDCCLGFAMIVGFLIHWWPYVLFVVRCLLY